MAIVRRADRYTVNTKLQEKFSDFVSPFDVNPDTGDIYRNINDFAIRESLKNILLTDLGERPFQPTLGGNGGKSCLLAAMGQAQNGASRLVTPQRH